MVLWSCGDQSSEQVWQALARQICQCHYSFLHNLRRQCRETITHQILRKTSTRAELITLMYSTTPFFTLTSGLTFQNVISRRNSTKYKKKKAKDKTKEKETTKEKNERSKPLQFIPLPHRYRLDRNWSSLVDSAIEGLLTHLSFRCSILSGFIIFLVSGSQILPITEQFSKTNLNDVPFLRIAVLPLIIIFIVQKS